MYTLSRILPDDTERPISAGMLARPADPLSCEIMPGEQVQVGFLGRDERTSQHFLRVSLDTQGHVGILPLGDLIHFKLRSDGGTTVVSVFDANPVMAEVSYSPALLLDDIRLFVKVFPLAGQETSLAVE